MKSPGQERAKTFLSSLIKQLNAQGEALLPSMSTLASQAGVSLVTMMKAIHALRDEGTVTGAERSRMRIVDSKKGLSGDDGSGNAGENQQAPIVPLRLEHQIAREIFFGRYAAGSFLPSAKELSASYGVNHRTIHKTLIRLADQSILAIRHKRFLVAQSSAHPQRNRMTFVTMGNERGNPKRWSSRSELLLRTFETECLGRNIAPDIVRYSFDSHRFMHLDGTRISAGRILAGGSTFGACIYTLGIHREALLAILASAQELSLPLSMLEDTGGDPGVRGSALCRMFRVAGTPLCGEMIGRHLLNLGHRRIAYISHVHDTPWSRNREAGLNSAAHAYGFADAIIPVVAEKFAEVIAVTPQRQADLERVRSYCYRDDNDGALTRWMFDELQDEVGAALDQRVSTQAIQPLLAQAMKSGATAWACASDTVALQAFARAQGAGIRVPQVLSIAGFDDSAEGFEHRLSSYNFNLTGTIGAMVNHVASPSRTTLLYGRTTDIDVPGFVVPRETTGPVRGQ